MQETRFIRAYLRASTEDQNAERAREQLIQFAHEHGHKIASFYIENESGATLERPELHRLIADAQEGDVLLVEQIDRLTRLRIAEWESLKATIKGKRLLIVATDLPTSHGAMKVDTSGDEFTGRMLQAVNDMMVDMLAAIARKDYETRRDRQAQGIEDAKKRGAYRGRPADEKRNQGIAKRLLKKQSWADIEKLEGCSRSTIARIAKELKASGELQ